MRIFTLLPVLITLLSANLVMAEEPPAEARGSVYALIPMLVGNMAIKGDVDGIGLFGVGLNYKWRNNLYTGAQATAWFNGTDDFGKSYDLNLGYSVNLNTNKEASWLIDVVPQMGYRYASRWYYYRDGYGPENISHGVLMGASYSFYQNKAVGFVIRAHTLFEWAPYSVIAPNNLGDNFDEHVYVTGIDVGLSVGLSFGH